MRGRSHYPPVNHTHGVNTDQNVLSVVTKRCNIRFRHTESDKETICPGESSPSSVEG